MGEDAVRRCGERVIELVDEGFGYDVDILPRGVLFWLMARMSAD